MENITEREECQSIEETIKNNEVNTKPLLQHRKFKKFNYLKYKPNSTTEETPQPTKHKTGFQKTYASVAQGTNNPNTNVSITHKSNNTNAENESQTLLRNSKHEIRTNNRKVMENQHLEALPKQNKNQVQGTKKSKILKTKYEF